jgi:hypothetical protein
MDASTRPPHKRLRAAAIFVRGLVAVLFAASPHHASSATRNNTEPLPATQHASAAPTAHDIGISNVKPGAESLELSARFSEDNQELVQGITWVIRNEMGATVFNGIATTADALLPAGDYQVEAHYGTVDLLQGMTVHPGTKLSVNFILNAGGLRVLSQVKGMGPIEVSSRSIIYALSGIAKGQLVTTSHTPGEVIKLRVGDYRVESHFDLGNAVAITEVHIRPGMISAVQILHMAGVAKLSVANPVTPDFEWTITDENGATLSPVVGASASLVLRPGHYSANAWLAGTKVISNFTVTAGQTQDIIIGQ